MLPIGNIHRPLSPRKMCNSEFIARANCLTTAGRITGDSARTTENRRRRRERYEHFSRAKSDGSDLLRLLVHQQERFDLARVVEIADDRLL